MKILCNDLIYLIFQDLELKDIISLSQTCKYFMRFYKYNEDYIFEKLILKKGLNKYILDDIMKIYCKYENKYDTCISSTKNGRCKYKKYSIYCRNNKPPYHIFCYKHKENVITMKNYYIIISRYLSLKYIPLNVFLNSYYRCENYIEYITILLFDEMKNIGKGFHNYKIYLFITFYNNLRLNIKLLDKNKIEIYILLYEKIDNYINANLIYFAYNLIKKWKLIKDVYIQLLLNQI